MKVESNIYPNPVTVESYGTQADIVLTENVTETSKAEMNGGESIIYQYDSYRITVTDRASLETSVAENFEQWIAFAKNEPVKPPEEADRLSALESAVLEMVLGGGV